MQDQLLTQVITIRHVNGDERHIEFYYLDRFESNYTAVHITPVEKSSEDQRYTKYSNIRLFENKRKPSPIYKSYYKGA